MASKAATALAKPATAEFVVSKVDQLVNWARKVSDAAPASSKGESPLLKAACPA